MSNKELGNRKNYGGGMDLPELERTAKLSRNCKHLHQMACDNFRNEEICKLIASNRYTSEDTMNLLACHRNKYVRLRVAERAENLSDRTILDKLAHDLYSPVRVALAKTTKDEDIKWFLFENSQNDNEIICYCLKRTKDISLIRKFIYQSSTERVIMFASQIFGNWNLTDKDFYSAILLLCKNIPKSLIPKILEDGKIHYRLSNEMANKFLKDFLCVETQKV